MRPAKAQISLGIRPVWSESSLCAQWVTKEASFRRADSENLSRWLYLLSRTLISEACTNRYLEQNHYAAITLKIISGNHNLYLISESDLKYYAIPAEIWWLGLCNFDHSTGGLLMLERLRVFMFEELCFWAPSWENLFLPYANNKGADQPAHSRSLISAFAVRCLDSICIRNFKPLHSSL